MTIQIHPTAIIDENVTIGEGTKIWHYTHVSKGAVIGKDCVLGQNVYVGNNVRIGNGCKLQNNVSVFEGVTLEDNVFCGPSMTFTNVYTPRAEVNRKDEFGFTYVKQGATLGAGSVIICGKPRQTRIIGSYSFVGAGTVVNKRVEDYALVVGNPMRHIGWVCKCGDILTKKMDDFGTHICARCKDSFRLEPKDS